jgi:hypothetical protein
VFRRLTRAAHRSPAHGCISVCSRLRLGQDVRAVMGKTCGHPSSDLTSCPSWWGAGRRARLRQRSGRSADVRTRKESTKLRRYASVAGAGQSGGLLVRDEDLPNLDVELLPIGHGIPTNDKTVVPIDVRHLATAALQPADDLMNRTKVLLPFIDHSPRDTLTLRPMKARPWKGETEASIPTSRPRREVNGGFALPPKIGASILIRSASSYRTPRSLRSDVPRTRNHLTSPNSHCAASCASSDCRSRSHDYFRGLDHWRAAQDTQNTNGQSPVQLLLRSVHSSRTLCFAAKPRDDTEDRVYPTDFAGIPCHLQLKKALKIAAPVISSVVGC